MRVAVPATGGLVAPFDGPTMDTSQPPRKLYLLWYLAALIAAAAVAIAYYKVGTVDWIGLFLAAVCAVMGYMNYARSRRRDVPR
jgi:hypothetical protein